MIAAVNIVIVVDGPKIFRFTDFHIFYVYSVEIFEFEIDLVNFKSIRIEIKIRKMSTGEKSNQQWNTPLKQ